MSRKNKIRKIIRWPITEVLWDYSDYVKTGVDIFKVNSNGLLK